jgi:hypothetical protein
MGEIMPLEELDKKGFVFLDEDSRPFRCAMWGGLPWLFYWNDSQRAWVSLRPVSQMEIWTFPRNLTQKEQDLYFEEEKGVGNLSDQELKELNEYLKSDIRENGKYYCCYCFKRYKEETAVENVCNDCLKSRYVKYGATAEGCAFCKNLSSDYDCDDMGYNTWFWFKCDKVPQYQNLCTFPFKNTPKLCIKKGFFEAMEIKYYACR